MRTGSMIVGCLLLLACTTGSKTRVEAQDSGLANELALLRTAWLHEDDAAAVARLEVLRADNRLSGDLPRWLTMMRAWLALQEGDEAATRKLLLPMLEESQDARNYVRVTRLCLALGHAELALAFIRHGRARSPESPTLARFEAELLYLTDDTSAALEGWRAIVVADTRPAYPYLPPNGGTWANVRPWNATAAQPPKPAEPADSRGRVKRVPAEAGEYTPEPFASLFMPLHWYDSDQPGFDRCLHELATRPAVVKAQAEALEGLCDAARIRQRELESFRGDLPERAKLVRAATDSRYLALVAVRIVAASQLALAKSAEAEATVLRGLELEPDNIPCNDLLAQCYAGQGKAEEARNGPLSRLKVSAGLIVTMSGIHDSDVNSQVADRVFAPAHALYRVNQQSGRDQFKKLRASFGDPASETGVAPEALGLWLMLHGENQLARELLRESSSLGGIDGGKPLGGHNATVELALALLGEPDADQLAPGESVPDADLATSIRNMRRIGPLINACGDTQSLIYELSGISLWGPGSAQQHLFRGADAMPDGREKLGRLLYGSAATLAATAGKADLTKALDPAHTESKSLSDSLKSLADTLESLRSTDNWRTRQALGQQAGPVLGKLETRALLLRAKLLQDAPADLKSLGEWLRLNQGPIDARTQLRATTDDAYARAQTARTGAGVPEVVHADLALDAALLLARAGKFADAANLLWLNRGARFGATSTAHRMYIGSLLARKAGQQVLAARFRLLSTGSVMESNSAVLDMQVCELPFVRKHILEFGTAADVLEFVQLHLVVAADSAALARMIVHVPEMKDATPNLILRNTPRLGTDAIFEGTVTSGTLLALHRNWTKILIASESPRTPGRLLGWAIASDFGIANRFSDGIADGPDTVRIWQMVLAWRKHHASDPRYAGAASRLAGMLGRIGEPTNVAPVEEYYEYWD